VVGIDIGGTKTHLAIGRGGAVADERIVPTSTWRTRSPEQDAAALADQVRAAFGERALTLPFGLGATGCDTTAQCLTMERELAVHTSGPVRVVNDAELMPWSMGVSAGIGVVSGTGAIAVARDPRGGLVTCGGWGWLLGDEGGAAGIVREATRAALAELDAGRADDPLVVRLLAALGAADGAGLAMALTLSSSADSWGGHAKEVFAAADEGSPVALQVVDGAALHLAALVERLLERGIAADQVVAGGAVVQGQERLRTRFVGILAERLPEVSVSVLDRPPVVGALALAASAPLSPVPSTSLTNSEAHS
jgi:glucosamine kinase